MKPPAFHYRRAETIDEAMSLLADDGEDTKVLAGGQSLVALLNLRLARPEIVLDIGRLAELRGYEEQGGEVVVGALTTQRQLELDRSVATLCPLLAAAIPFVAHVAVRNRGTIGGSIAHADSSAELPVVLAALGGSVTLRSLSGTRRVSAADFFRGFLYTSAQPDELLTQVRLPLAAGDTGYSFVEFARRPGDFALVSVGAVVARRPDGMVGSVRLALGGLASTPVVTETEHLAGRSAEEAGLGAAELADEIIEPATDLHASAEYRRHLVRTLVARAVADASGTGADKR